VVQRGCGFGFPLETAQSLRVVGEIVWKKLQGNESAELKVFRFVDYPHAASADLFDDAVVRDGLADHSERALRRRHIRSQATASQCTRPLLTNWNRSNQILRRQQRLFRPHQYNYDGLMIGGLNRSTTRDRVFSP